MIWPESYEGTALTPHQIENLQKACVGKLGILGGGPGCGKTFSAAAMLKIVGEKIGFDNIAVAGPTGKSAVRITEVMSSYSIPIQARTWHSLLGVGDQGDDLNPWGFQHNEDNPLPFKLIVGDESSMVCTDMMCSIFRARARDCHILLLGDVNQLAPVGHGAPLRDLIAAGVPYGELREIKRNSGGIVETCAAIRDAQPWQPSDNLQVIEADPFATMVEQLAEAKRAGLDPVWDCQVLVAVNEKSKLSRKAVNEFLQGELNPNARVPGCPFRIADKVVCLKNADFPLIEDGSGEAEQGATARVMNGELGSVVEIADRHLVVRVDDPFRLIRVPRGKSDGDEGSGCNWDLGYGLSCHKSQGSEWKWVLVLIDDYPGAKMVCDRSWAYTAISRAKQRCILIGKKSVADAMCRRVAIWKRKTFLRELVQLNLAKMEMAGL